MTYLDEFRTYWPNLLGATLGVALGSALHHYMTNLFAPALIGEFGWDRSQFALIGTLGLVSMVFVPVAGRLADRHGARIAGGVGFVMLPLCFVLYSFMSGPIWQFFAITILQHVFGVLAAPLVFSRVVVERFDVARGMALSLLMSGAPLVGAVAAPLIGEYIDAEGWRAGYRLMAAISGLGGLIAICLIGPRAGTGAKTETGRSRPMAAMAPGELSAIFRSPAFLLIVSGMLFCNVPQIIVSSQLKLVLLDNGASSTLATWVVSLYAGGVIVGRLVSGLALDKASPQLVAIVALGLPAAGFMALASPFDAGWVLGGAILLVGLAQGAEGDIGAYLTSRTFDIRHFSFVYSFLIASMGVGTAVGSLTLSVMLDLTENFNLFLVTAAVLTIIGALCFFLTGFGSQATSKTPIAK